MPDDEQEHARRPDAAVFPVSRVRSSHVVPNGVVVALVVGVLAFLGGIGVASSGPVQSPRSALPAASVPAAAWSGNAAPNTILTPRNRICSAPA